MHYKIAPERLFLAEERAGTTILFGTLTPKHEAFIRAVFRGAGYCCENLPPPTRSCHETGKEFCNNGLCNPNYFTAGNLIEYLRARMGEGMTAKEVVDRYAYFTAGGCGPCRFGMYESEYRNALESAGFHGFRIITFQSHKAIKEGSAQPGLKFTVDFGFGMFNALNLGDILFDLTYQIRPYEIRAGETDRVLGECVAEAARFLEKRKGFELVERVPPWVARLIVRAPAVKKWGSVAAKARYHLYGSEYLALIDCLRERINSIEVDRTQPKPLVKITGEFFSALTEGETNYNVFAFLEHEGAEVMVESIVGLILYWLYQSRLQNQRRRTLRSAAEYWGKDLLFRGCDRFWTGQYNRVRQGLGSLARPLVSQERLGEVAAPYYGLLTRGGEGYLEIAKSLHYTRQRKCHMVLSLKPFGCMPSTQSDGVMALVAAKHSGMVFLPVETAADGEVNALSRVQMALGDARRRARLEFENSIEGCGIPLEKIREYVMENRELRRPFHRWPGVKGVEGTAAQFVRHAAKEMR